jgi:nucleoid-associated protein YgaU
MPDTSNRSGGPDRAKLLSVNPSAPGAVVFDYNPTKVNFTRSVTTAQRQTAAGPTPSIFKRCELAQITLNDIILEGDDTKARCDLLMNWTAPPQNPLVRGALALLGVESTEQPSLIFQWGPPDVGFFYKVKLITCNASYVRFNSQGWPVRAEVALTLKEEPNVLGTLPTNPSSGGIAGRRVHTVREGERLAGITDGAYGHPRHWRALARANGIDDPLRIRPGDAVYLPPASEFAPRGRR